MSRVVRVVVRRAGMVLLAGLMVATAGCVVPQAAGAAARPAQFVPLPAARVFGQPVAAGVETAVPVAGRGGVPASGATAVFVTVTGVRPFAAVHIDVWPNGQAKPDTPVLTVPGDVNLSSSAIVALGADGALRVRTTEAATIQLEVSGYFAATANSGRLVPVDPARVLDTRVGTGAPAVRIPAGKAVDVPVREVAGVPPDAAAVLLNVTVPEPGSSGGLMVFPAGTTRPATSTLVYPATTASTGATPPAPGRCECGRPARPNRTPPTSTSRRAR